MNEEVNEWRSAAAQERRPKAKKRTEVPECVCHSASLPLCHSTTLPVSQSVTLRCNIENTLNSMAESSFNMQFYFDWLLSRT